jgi:hypothetical protein
MTKATYPDTDNGDTEQQNVFRSYPRRLFFQSAVCALSFIHPRAVSSAFSPFLSCFARYTPLHEMPPFRLPVPPSPRLETGSTTSRSPSVLSRYCLLLYTSATCLPSPPIVSMVYPCFLLPVLAATESMTKATYPDTDNGDTEQHNVFRSYPRLRKCSLCAAGPY